MFDNDTDIPDTHTDANAIPTALPADDLPGMADWTDAHTGPMSDAELDVMWAADMERRDAEHELAENRTTPAIVSPGDVEAVGAIAALFVASTAA